MNRANATYLCSDPPGGPCPKCGRETEKDYTGARHCMEDTGGCGWSDWDDPDNERDTDD